MFNSIISQYADAFEKHYPSKKLAITKARKAFPDSEQKFWVIIDGNRGEKPLETRQMIDAINSFA